MDEIANGPVFQRHRAEQNKALEQANRTLAKKSLEMAETKIDRASYSQLVFGAAIMTDKARLLAGESTQNIAHSVQIDAASIDGLCSMLGQSLIERRTIDVTPREESKEAPLRHE